jgi:hypothetical protein
MERALKTNILYAHIGYPKTATTALQSSVYPYLDDVRYIGITYPISKRGMCERKLVQGLIYPPSQRGVNRFKCDDAVEVLSRFRSNFPDERLFFSCENLLSQCIHPRFCREKSEVIPPPTLEDVLLYFKKMVLASGFDGLKLMVSVRQQSALFSSHYAEAYRNQYSQIPEIRHFEDAASLLVGGSSKIPKSSLDYVHLDDVASEVFSRENVSFFSYDLLRLFKEEYANQLADFFNIPREPVQSLMKGASRENVRSKEGGSGEVLLARKDYRQVLDKLKRRIVPNTSLGIGRHLGPILRKVNYGPREFVPSDEALRQIDKIYLDSNEEFFRRYPHLQVE